MVDRARLAVDEAAGEADLAAEGLDDRLMAEADAEDRHARAADELDDARRRPARPGRDHEPLGLELLEIRLVVSPHDHLGAERPEQVREVVRERVVVVDEQDHAAGASSARSIASSRAASLRRHSSCSAAGSESATIPAPACSPATPSTTTIVRLARQGTEASGVEWPTPAAE